MPRNALRAFFRRALILAPLSLAGCPTSPVVGQCHPQTQTNTIEVAVDMDLPDALAADACVSLCQTSGLSTESCAPSAHDWDAGTQQVACTGKPYCLGGRRPSGLVERASSARDAVGSFFAELSQLEDASVHAFRLLAAELRAHGAPRSLVARAEAAARDEIRHARVTGNLAKRHGARPLRARVAATTIRELSAIAEENAVEGCVRETFGALLAGWQALHAADPQIRRAMKAIAADEEGHAELAWDVDAWAARRLGRDFAEVRRSAARALAAELQDPDPTLVSVAGLPSAPIARALHQQALALWS